ncbi:CHASE2 domain-containing protein [Dechloromonas sp. H13]|uniref:CHASE2 domain-containing protein n=1 Tax=Dechloromonas sp. H13 TaxID=2570193 RepID=UPI0012909A3C|nr:CHASE2 domain-containing protein [Dechloromonas sp. H13]
MRGIIGRIASPAVIPHGTRERQIPSQPRHLLLALLQAGRGRALPLLFLALAVLALANFDATPLPPLRNAQFDRYQRQMPRTRDGEPVIVVGIDSASLLRHGQWPWSRDLMADLTSRILAGRPHALGIDIVFAERDRFAPPALAERFPTLPPATFAGLPGPDEQLAAALAGGPTVLAVIGVANALPGSRQPSRPLPALAAGDPAMLAALTRFPAAIASLTLLEGSAAGAGLVNATLDGMRSTAERGVLRRVPTLALVGDQPFLSLPLEMVRVALGAGGQVAIEAGPHGMQGIRVGDYALPTQGNGELLLHYGRSKASYYLSAADVLAGAYPPETFTSRFVLIGFNSTGLQDATVTPLGELLPGVDIHAQIIESLLAGTALRRPAWMPQVEMAALLLGGLLLIVAVPVLRPRYATLAFVALIGLLLAAGHFAFAAGRWLFDGLSLVPLLAPVFISLLSATLIAADARRRQAEAQLQASREAAARIDGELDAARRIQMGLLPDPSSRFAGETRFAVAALLEPARAIGGDYYDCFMLDERRLCLAIGDVSGKGIPASLFMAISKTLAGTLTRRHDDLGQAVCDLQRELNRDNPEFQFVTTFIGILDADSGLLEFVCAGHDAPLLLSQGAVRPLDIARIAGPPLCALANYPFASARLQLLPGDLLCLFTDGISEASDGREMFGTGRLAAALLAGSSRAPLAERATAIRDAVRRFEAGQAPFDDLTLLLAVWCGRPPT